MNEIASAPTIPRNDTKENLNWKDNLSVQKLLDVIASIIADEYIQIAKQNPDTFSNNGGLK
jgi:hypothetical protein